MENNNINIEKEYTSVVKSLNAIIAEKNAEIEKLSKRLEGANSSILFWSHKCDELEAELKKMGVGEDEEEPEYNDKSNESN